MYTDLQKLNKQAGVATKNIEGEDYTVHLLKTTVGLAMSLEIGKLIAPSIGAGVDGFNHDEILHGAPTTFADLGKLLVTQMGEVNIVVMVATLLTNLELDGKRVDFETHFMGDYGKLAQLVEFALRENFSSFFTGSGFQTRILEMVKNLTAQPADQGELVEK